MAAERDIALVFVSGLIGVGGVLGGTILGARLQGNRDLMAARRAAYQRWLRLAEAISHYFLDFEHDRDVTSGVGGRLAELGQEVRAELTLMAPPAVIRLIEDFHMFVSNYLEAMVQIVATAHAAHDTGDEALVAELQQESDNLRGTLAHKYEVVLMEMRRDVGVPK